MLQKQHEQSTKSQNSAIVNQRETQSQAAQAAAVSAAVQAASAEFAQATAAAAAASVAANNSGGSGSGSDQVDVVDSMQEDNNSASDLASMKNRRRGRPPKNSNMDLSYR